MIQSNYNDMAAGMVRGLLNVQPDEGDFNKCIFDEKKIMGDIVQGIEDLASFDINGLMGFLDKIGNACYTFEHHAEVDCNPFSDEEAFNMALKTDSSENNLSWYHNYETLSDFKDLINAREEYKNENWGMMGYYIGKTVSQLELLEDGIT